MSKGLRAKSGERRTKSCIICIVCFVFCPLLIALAGCAILGSPSARKNKENTLLKHGSGVSSVVELETEGTLPKSFQLHDVPHNPRRQEGTDCAPDSLRMVLNYRGKSIAKDWDIPQQLTGRGAGGGTSFYQMQQIAAKSYGLPAFIIHNCDLQSLKACIVSKWPPIIGYRSSGRYYHAVVAVGYDDKRRTMLVHDPNYLMVRKIRYYDLGGVSKDSVQRLSCLLVSPKDLTEKDLRIGLEKYVPKELVSKLRVSSMFPS